MKLLLAAVLLTGCASFQPAVYPYPRIGITLVCADEVSIDKACRTPGMRTDKGAPYPSFNAERDANGFMDFHSVLVPACFKPKAREIWMKWGEWCDTMAHELCHAEGLDAAYCEDHYPRRLK